MKTFQEKLEDKMRYGQSLLSPLPKNRLLLLRSNHGEVAGMLLKSFVLFSNVEQITLFRSLCDGNLMGMKVDDCGHPNDGRCPYQRLKTDFMDYIAIAA